MQAADSPQIASDASDFSEANTSYKINWKTAGAVTKKVGNMKEYCQLNLCCFSDYAFAAIGAIEGAHQIASGDLVPLSAQQVVDCSNEGGCTTGTT